MGGFFSADADNGGWLDAYTRIMGGSAETPFEPTNRYDQQIRRGGAVPDLADMHIKGYIGDAQYASIREGWNKVADGEITFEEMGRLADDLSAVIGGLPDVYQAMVISYFPELAVNMVQVREVVLDRVPDDVDHQGTKLISPAGQPGADLRDRGKRELWYVLSAPEDFYDRAFSRAGRAQTTLRNAAWTSATHLEGYTKYPETEPNSKGVILADIPIDMYADTRNMLAALNINPDGITTRGELAEALNAATYMVNNNFLVPANTPPLPPALDLKMKDFREQAKDSGWDPDDTSTWSNGALATVRAEFEPYFQSYKEGLKGAYNPEDYDTYWARFLGPRAWESLEPPDLTTIPMGTTNDTFRMTVPAGIVEVVDGDTVKIPYNDIDPAEWMGQPDDLPGQRIRLIGINADEKNVGRDGWYAEQGLVPPSLKQEADLEEKIANATTIDFVVFQPDRFAVLQEVDNGEVRWLMVMYVDGDPLWDSEIFTPSTPSGAAIGGRGIPDVSE